MLGTVVCFIGLNSLNAHNTPLREVLDLERLSNLPTSQEQGGQNYNW